MKGSDLHIHSCFSDDGEFTAEEIVNIALHKNMGIISITDHNSVKAIEPALTYARSKKIRIIPGIEIDCTFKDVDLHLLGYNIDYTLKCFEDLELSILEQERASSVEKIVRIAEHTGLSLNTQEVLKKSSNGVVTGELIAEMLLADPRNMNSEILKPYKQNGNRSDMPYVNFYWDYFSKGKPAYVPMEYISLESAINMVHNSGGLAVVAHPGNNLKHDLNIIDELIHEGIDGIEAFSTYHSASQTAFFYGKAVENNLIITCGSDFHGKNKPHIQIGDFGQGSELMQGVDLGLPF